MIELADLKSQYQRVKPAIDDRIQQVLDHGKFIMGPEVHEFEAEFAKYCGVSHAVGVSNGTDALLMALMAEGVGPGDLVFVPSFTFTATAEVILMVGAKPVFVDVDGRTFNIDVEDLRHKIEGCGKCDEWKPRAIMPVDLFGLPAPYGALETIAREFNLTIIADAAQSCGGELGNRRVGALAPMTCFSFFPVKPLGCYGDGGAVVTDDPKLAELLRSIRAHGMGDAKYEIVRVGLNARLDTIQAAVLIEKLRILPDEIAARRRIAAVYEGALGDAVTVPLRPDDAGSAWAQYSILAPNRDDVVRQLNDANIKTAIYYPLPMHMQPAYRNYGEGEGSLPVSERLSREILSLPIHPYLEMEAVRQVADAVRNAVEGR